MITSQNSVKSVRKKFRILNMEDAILIWRMLNTPFKIILYKIQVMKVFYLAPKIIASGVIINKK